MNDELNRTQRRLERANHKIVILEKMIEDKTREIFIEKEKIRKVNVYLEEILNTMADGLIVTDKLLNITQTNHAIEKLLDQSKEMLIGQSFQEFLPSRKVMPLSNLDSLGEKQHFSEEVLLENKDRPNIPILISGSFLTDNNNSIKGMICIVHDLTERKNLELKLAQAQKLESIGQLSAGIAHEINTPMQYLSDNTGYLQQSFVKLKRLFDAYDGLYQAFKNKTDTDKTISKLETLIEETNPQYQFEEIPEAFQDSIDGIEGVTSIVSALRDFSHPEEKEKSPVDINKNIETTLTVAKSEWKYHAAVETNFDESLSSVFCMPGELNQVILNLVVNAAHAIADKTDRDSGEKGKITIQTKEVNNFAEIRIKDTGCGIPEEVRDKVFDPFFTTKDVGRGTGQGLAISYDVITNMHGGSIAFETEIGVGTTFIIQIPLDDEMNVDEERVEP